MVPSNIAFHSNRSHSSRISTASHLHRSACASLWMRLVRAILYTWLTSLRGTDDLYDATLECARGKFFLVWRKIRNYRFGIFNFDAELEWCKFRALTVLLCYIYVYVDRSLFVAVVVCCYQLSPFYVFLLMSCTWEKIPHPPQQKKQHGPGDEAMFFMQQISRDVTYHTKSHSGGGLLPRSLCHQKCCYRRHPYAIQ